MSVTEQILPLSPPAPPATEMLVRGISLGETMSIALENLAANKLRSLLTTLGVIIGVAAVVALLAIGHGVQDQITAQILANGANLLTVRTDTSHSQSQGPTISYADALALADASNVPDAMLVAPEYQFPAVMSVGSHNSFAPGYAVTPEYAPMHHYQLAEGSFITQEQLNRASNVVVLGAKAANQLFNGQDPLGKQVRIQGISFKVIGVLAAKGGNSFGSADYSAYVPISYAFRILGHEQVGSEGGSNAVSAITVQARDQNSINLAISEIDATLRARHRLPSDGSSDDFTIDNQQDLINTETASTRTLTLFLAAIAGISLVVGGIGIMNVMLMSVRERTREIGLRKAVGARERDVLRQFIIEALALATSGGVVGVVIGGTVAFIVSQYGIPATITADAVLMAVGFSFAVGLFFGIEPARRAARLDPITALRYE
jgi:putative ABC transport system permease protein